MPSSVVKWTRAILVTFTKGRGNALYLRASHYINIGIFEQSVPFCVLSILAFAKATFVFKKNCISNIEDIVLVNIKQDSDRRQ